METTLNRATQLLQSGEPEHALLLLNEQNDSSAESEHLKEICKRALSEQYLWLLNEAAKSNRMNEVQTYVNRYLNLIGKDERVARYEKMANTAFSSNNNHQVPHCSEYSIGKFALIPVVFLLLLFLANACRRFFDGNIWTILNYVTAIFNIFYVISVTIVFSKIKGKCNLDRDFIWLFVWSSLWLIAGISDVIRGCYYVNFIYLQGVRICFAAGNLSLIIFLIKQIKESFRFKTALIIAIIAIGLDIVRLSVSFYGDYQWYSYLPCYYSTIGMYYGIEYILYYGYSVLMMISFTLFFVISQKNKQYGTN